jgi:Ca2+-transporting ATPase
VITEPPEGAALGAALPWCLEPAAVAAAWRTDLGHGLDPAEATRRLAGGRNVLPVSRPPSTAALVLDQLRDTMIVVLLCAGTLTAIVGDLADTLIIALVVALNTTLGVSQQRRAQRAISALASLTVPSARVVRSDGTRVIPSADVVPGDLVEVAAGDLVPADGRLIAADTLEVDEALLTGESVAARKTADACPGDLGVADRTSMLHAGTLVTRGRGRVVVTATGAATEVGSLARLLVSTVPPTTPLQAQLARFGRGVAAVTVGLCVAVLVIGLLRGEPFETMVLTAISLAVAAIPESLPAAVVLSLAMAAQRMARRSAVVRTLPAVEALGAVTVIASDKTGTLTEGVMFANGFWTPDGSVSVSGTGYAPAGTLTGAAVNADPALDLLRAVVLCNDAELLQDDTGWVVAGEPMEGALLALAGKGGVPISELRARWPRLQTYAFDHERSRMTTSHGNPDGGVTVLCKGAPEVLLGLMSGGDGLKDAAAEQLALMTAAGLRVLAVARGESESLPRDAAEAEGSLHLLGLVALHDPPRQGVAAAVRRCRQAGVVPVMITGDHPSTAAAIATSVGILDEGGIVVTGQDVTAGRHRDRLEQIRVYARTAPEQKLEIVDALRSAGQVVAMTGDGVNDAPALRRADVGVAMGRSGSEVARQAADIVLLDDNFTTLVAAVEEGRRVYDNVRRFLLFGVSGGVAELLIMLAGPAVGLALPLLPGQILWVNMLTHGLPGVALGAERAEDDVLSRPPRDPRQGVLGDRLLTRILLLGALVGAVSLSLGVWATHHGLPGQSMIFVTLTVQQLGVAITLRSQQRSILSVGLRGNPYLLLSVGLNLVLLWLAVSWSPLVGLLGTHQLSGPELALCAGAGLLAPLSVELAKLAGRRRARAIRLTGAAQAPEGVRTGSAGQDPLHASDPSSLERPAPASRP